MHTVLTLTFSSFVHITHFMQLTTLCHSLLGRNLGGRSPVMQPSTDVGRRSLVSLVLQTTAVILQNSANPLLEPFVNVLNATQGLNVFMCIQCHIHEIIDTMCCLTIFSSISHSFYRAFRLCSYQQCLRISLLKL